MGKNPPQEREDGRVSDHELREDVLRRFSTQRLVDELKRRGIHGYIRDNLEESIPESVLTVNPSHYKNLITVTTSTGEEIEVPFQVVDVCEQFGLSDKAHIMTAVIYLLRAGKKAIADEIDDWAKARWWITRAINFHGGHPEVPKE